MCVGGGGLFVRVEQGLQEGFTGVYWVLGKAKQPGFWL